MSARASILELVRDDLRGFGGYASARRAGVEGRVWLNANESPQPNPADGGGGAHRYPSPQPAPLRRALAGLYGVEPEQVLVGRGSDEAIDLLVRAMCRPGVDAVAFAPPVFGMYAVSARLQGAPVIEVPLQRDGEEYRTDIDALARAADEGGARLIFLCSPANPTGQCIGLQVIADLAKRVEGRAMVVVDEAYGEYADQASASTLLPAHPNLGVLRTLSKAHALASARVGCLLAAAELIALLRNVQAPYPLPGPSVALALAALAPKMLERTHAAARACVRRREALREQLLGMPGVRCVHPSQGNFLLVRFDRAGDVFEQLLAAGIVVRDMRTGPGLEDALRVTVGSEEENRVLIETLRMSVGAPS